MKSARLPILVGAGAGFILVAGFAWRAWRNGNQRGHLIAVHLVGKALLAEDALSDGTVHLVVLDAEDGHLLGRAPESSRANFLGAATGGYWFEERGGDGIYRRSARTLEVDRSPELPDGARAEGTLVPGQGIPLKLRGGRLQWLDAESGEVRPAFEEHVAHPATRASSSAIDGFGGTVPVATLGRACGHANLVSLPTGEKVIECSGQPRGKTALIDPAFIAPGDDRTALVLDGPSFLLVHRASMTADPTLHVSRVDCSGEARWTVVLPGGQVTAAVSSAERVFFAARLPSDTDALICVDLASGDVRWSY